MPWQASRSPARRPRVDSARPHLFTPGREGAATPRSARESSWAQAAQRPSRRSWWRRLAQDQTRWRPWPPFLASRRFSALSWPLTTASARPWSAFLRTSGPHCGSVLPRGRGRCLPRQTVVAAERCRHTHHLTYPPPRRSLANLSTVRDGCSWDVKVKVGSWNAHLGHADGPANAPPCLELSATDAHMPARRHTHTYGLLADPSLSAAADLRGATGG